jgi:hypothetical protein
MPIIQSNAIVESFWSVFKKEELRKIPRPRLEFLVDIIMNRRLVKLSRMIMQHRDLSNPIKPTWYHPIVGIF